MAPNRSDTTTSGDDSLSLRDLARLAHGHLAEYRRRWLTLLTAALLCGGALGIYAWSSPPVFTGNLTYMLADNQLGRSASFLSQFSNLFGMAPPGAQAFAQLTEISRSFNLVSEVLFQKKTLDGREDFLANHIIRAEKLHENLWAPSRKDAGRGFSLHDFYFTHSNLDSFSLREQTAVKSLFNALQGLPAGRDRLLECDYDDETGIMSIAFHAHNEALAAEFPQALFAALREYYLRSSTELQVRTLELMTLKTDSLRRVLEGRERSQARFQDRDDALLFQEDRLPSVRLERERQMLGLLYGEAIKNREVADFALQNALPALQIIERPYPPLLAERKNPLQFAVLGSVLGAFLVCVFLSFRLLWREAVD